VNFNYNLCVFSIRIAYKNVIVIRQSPTLGYHNQTVRIHYSSMHSNCVTRFLVKFDYISCNIRGDYYIETALQVCWDGQFLHHALGCEANYPVPLATETINNLTAQRYRVSYIAASDLGRSSDPRGDGQSVSIVFYRYVYCCSEYQ
jgi:hypothetical protein